MKLIIDLGHGGKDPGAIGQNKTKESERILKIGKELDNLLKNTDLNYKFTRLSDTYISLNDRVEITNKYKANYFISLHLNSCNDKSVRGVEVYQYDDNDKELNEFSRNVCNNISKNLKIRNRGLKYNKNFVVLKNTLMSACLIEIDFLSNKEFEKNLKDGNYIKNISKLIYQEMIKLTNLSENDKNNNDKESDKLYRVCVGTFKEKQNAIKCVKSAKNKGFKDAYII